eukprot:5326037-Lingulodinium_polyedra.AAC.1
MATMSCLLPAIFHLPLRGGGAGLPWTQESGSRPHLRRASRPAHCRTPFRERRGWPTPGR